MKVTSYKISKQLAEDNGINRKTFAARVRSGLSLNEAATKPLFTKSDLTGKRFGKLIVLSHAGYDKRRQDKWLCKCDCGNESDVYQQSLRNGDTVSCGCHRKTWAITHGAAKTPLHNVWQCIKQRCLDKNHKNYQRYGARGIKICDRWKSDFNNFRDDMGERPSPNHSIERIDNNGDYEPSNCRWATPLEQSRNRRSNMHITFDNQTKILIEWCEYLNLPYKTIGGRIRDGWTPEKAFTTPIRKNYAKRTEK